MAFNTSGQNMSFDGLPPDRVPLRPGFGGKTINVERGGDTPQLVDHSWMDDISPPPFVGRDVALDNTPDLARFKDFGLNVAEEIRMEEEQAEFELNRSVHRQVIDKIQSILSQALADHESSLQIKSVVEDAVNDDGWEVTAGARFLMDQVGVAGHLYQISGGTERDCRRHAAKLKRRARVKPRFVAMRVGCKLDQGLVSRIYKLPVRPKIKYSTSDFAWLAAQLDSLGGSSRKVMASLGMKKVSLAAKYRQLKRQIMGMKTRKATLQSQVVAHPVKPGASKRPVVAASKGAKSKKKMTFLHNLVFAAMAQRDFDKLEELSQSSNAISSKFGGPRAYRAAVIDILSTVPGFRLNPDDFKEIAGSGKRIAVSTVAKKLHLGREEHVSLKRALEANVVMSREECDTCGESSKTAGWGKRDFSPVGETEGVIRRTEDYANTDDEDGAPDFELEEAPEVSNIPAAKYSSKPPGVEAFRKGLGRQVGMPKTLANKAKQSYQDQKKTLLPDQHFLRDQMGINMEEQRPGKLDMPVDLTMHDVFNPQQRPFFT